MALDIIRLRDLAVRLGYQVVLVRSGNSVAAVAAPQAHGPSPHFLRYRGCGTISTKIQQLTFPGVRRRRGSTN